MARGHGRILSSIWDDGDFTTLSEEEQRLYFFLLSQTNLNHAGLLPVTLLRWSRKAKGLTPAILGDRLAVLEGARFVVIDPETEELLIRSYVRNDGVWKQPNVMAAMVSAAQEIESPKLRRALLAEMDRLPLDLLSDEPSSRGGPSTRRQIETHLSNLRRLLVVPEPTPPSGGIEIPSGNPSENPSPRVGETHVEAIAEPSTRAGAPAYTRAAPSPSPPPSPEKTTTPGEASDDSLPLELVEVAETAKPPGKPKKPNKHQVADDLAAAFWEHHKAKTAQTFIAVRTVLRTALNNGLDRDDVARAIDHLANEGRALSGGSITNAVGQLRGRHLRAVSGGYQPHRNPDSDDVYDEPLYGDC